MNYLIYLNIVIEQPHPIWFQKLTEVFKELPFDFILSFYRVASSLSKPVITWRYCILVRIALYCYCHYSHRSNNRQFFSHTPCYFGNSNLAVLVLFCCNVAICSAFRTIALYKNECYFAMTL